MTGVYKYIMPPSNRKINSFIKSIIVLFLMVLFFQPVALFAQVISNTGATISVTSNIFVNSKDLENTTGTLSNNGTINLTGNYFNQGSANGNGFYNLIGNWTNLGTFSAGTSTVTLNGITNQTITHGSLGETFYRLTINNPGNIITQNANPGNTLAVLNNLNLIAGTLYLGQTTSNLTIGGKANIDGALIYNNLTTQTTTIGDTLRGAGLINMSPGNLPHFLYLAGRTNAIGTFTTSPTGSSTVNYNGTTQTVFPAANYRNLTISNSGVKTLQGNSIVGLKLNISGGTFDLGTTTTTLGVQGSTAIVGSLSFNGVSTKIVSLNDSLTGTGSIDMSGGNRSHFLYLNGVINSIGTYASGTGSTVDYVLSGYQTVFTSDDYRNLTISGSGVKILSADITAKGILTMLSGNINANGNTLKITNSATTAIVRTAGIVIGKLQRAIGTAGSEYLYPIGSATVYNPLKITFQNLNSGPLTAQFKPQDIGWSGPPLDDNGNEIYDRYTTGYWTLTSVVPMSSSYYNIKLNYSGFSGVDLSSRIIKRTNEGNFELDGKNGTLTGLEIARDSLVNGISLTTTDFAIGKGRPRIVSQPSNIDICEGSDAYFQVTARGHGTLSYRWQVDTGSGLFTNIFDVGVYSGSTNKKLIITGAPYSMNGYLYRCIITDGQGNSNITDPARLTVNKIPIATATPPVQDECPGVTFQTIVLGTSNNVTGTTFTWVRNNPAGITTSMPISGSAIGDQITGIFSNTSDAPIPVTFTITPRGPLTTYCVGNTITAIVTVNPTPRIFPVPSNTAQCDSTTTSIQLQSPSTFTSGFISFNYTVTTTGPVTGFVNSVGLPNNYNITDKLINLTDVYQVVTYSIVPVSPVVGCAVGATKSFSVTVNPTPSVRPVNLNNLKPDSSICFAGSTNILLTSLTQMSPGYGNIIFDYTVSVSGGPGILTGNMTPETARIPGYNIVRSYQNISDTIQSVYFSITPKVDNAICVPGRVFRSEIKVHPIPARRISIVKPLTCEGGSDATLRAITSKGADPLKVYWQGPFGYKDSTLFTITNRIGGNYRVTITDNLGCFNSKDTVVQGAFINSYLFAYPKAVNPNGTQFEISCPGYNDGDMLFEVSSGGTPPYEYWITRNSLDTTSAAFHGFFNLTGDPHTFSNLLAGKYTLFIKDKNGCLNMRPGLSEYTETTINEPDPITITFGKNNEPCKSDSKGKAWVKTTSGGNGGYTYKWKNSVGSIIGSSDTINNLTAGKYYLITTDIKSCTKLDSVIITEPDGMGLSGVVLKTSRDGNFNVSCNGFSDGEITLNIIGGSGTYLYHWSGPDGTTTTSINKISGLKAGHYTATVTDINGCVLSALDTILTQPTALDIVSVRSLAPDNINNINCSGGTGSINLTVTGGSIGNYKYTWSTSNGSGLLAGQRDQLNLTAGNYHVVVTDTNACSAPRDISLTQPQPISTLLSPTHITCYPAGFSNGSIDLTVSGGVGPYLYNWSNGATTEDINGLTQGYYKVTVRDINGCPRTDSVRINLPPDLTYTSVINSSNGYNISCFGFSDGSIQITPVTGKPEYIYNWTGPGGFVSTNQNISGLEKGKYNLQITDANQCKTTGIFNLTEPGKLGVTITLSASILGGYNINCAGTSTGSINVDAVNNVGAANYLWSDGGTGKLRSNMPAGTYDIIITDQNNCHADSTIILTEPDSIKTSFNVTQAFCPDSPDGEIRLSVTGGVIAADYSYKWSNNSISRDLTNIFRGFYKVTVTDGNNCSVKDSVVMEPLNKSCLIIPNAISPNNDNINDVWNIGRIELYPQMEIKIFNRWGELLWKSEKGYLRPWDGRSNGATLPIDSYHYIIDLHNGSKPIMGNITIVR
jgi:gliding motility-associated-like protein